MNTLCSCVIPVGFFVTQAEGILQILLGKQKKLGRQTPQILVPSMITGKNDGHVSLIGELHSETKRNILSN